jgi:antitoxin component YwqK of YwqJK toxin-antitoxin module
MYTREQYLKIIEALCAVDLNKAKEFFKAGDFDALHRIVVGNQGRLRDLGVISEPLSGTGETWHDNGQLESRGTYVDGKRHGALKWFYANGHLESSCTYVDGNCHGVWESWHNNGQLRSHSTFVDGKAHGSWGSWYDNGQLWMCGAYESGKRHGVWEWFHDGLIYERKTYDHGKLIKTEKF